MSEEQGFKLYEFSMSYNNLAEVIESNPDMDNEELLKALESIQESSKDKITNTGELIRKLEDNVAIIDKRMKELASAKKSLVNKVDSIKNYLLTHMQLMDMKKVSTGTITVSIRNNAPKLHIKDESKVPEQFKVYNTVLNVDSKDLPKEWQQHLDVNKSDIKINRQELTRAVKTMNEEEYAAYAALEPNPSITIK